jgi:RNA-splicing ligase RtcB
MIELRGKYNTAKLFTLTGEESAIRQIEHLLNQEFIKGSKIRIMPDAHAGAGCTIGTTMTITDKIVPNLVGVDIGCGIETVLLGEDDLDLKALDQAIHRNIPSGFKVRRAAHPMNSEIDLGALRYAPHTDLVRGSLSIGTLGGGNHFIELGRDEEGRLYLSVHSGSRNIGKQVCDHYQKVAADKMGKKKTAERELAYLEGELFYDYLHDMEIMQRYADINRRAMVAELERSLSFTIEDQFSTVHNYIDLDSMILRKGAISAGLGERMLIPMNMRDGSLICTGRGNEDWNFSAPHGAGRIMSRSAAKKNISLPEFEKSMEGIYSSTVNKSTIDEAPFAYKPMDEIIRGIGDTCDIVTTIKPLYNFKAPE